MGSTRPDHARLAVKRSQPQKPRRALPKPLRVWAPEARSVEVLVGGERMALERVDEWWTVDLPYAGEPVDYSIIVDGGPALPDPRSNWQPRGVHQASRAVDHAAFSWTDESWRPGPLSSAIIYELHIGTFSPEGTFDGAIKKLDHLVRLGVSHVEVMPIAEFPGERGWGYDGVHLFAVKHAYGGPDGFKRFVDACHAKGLAVVLDVVYNHLGPSGNYLASFGPYFTERHQTPWGSALNFDGRKSHEVRRYFCDNAIQWFRDYHVDALRLDAIHAIIDASAVPFLQQLAMEVEEYAAHLGKHLYLIAESDLNDPRVVRPYELGGYGLHAQWSDDFHHSLHAVITGEQEGYYSDFGRLKDLAKALCNPFVYAGRLSNYRARPHGRPAVEISGHKFVICVQNHDQVGNRAQGDRLCMLVNRDRAKMAAAIVLLSPFIPMLFQGEEWACSSPFQYFVDYGDEPELAAAITEGRRREFADFGWQPEDVPDPQERATFERSRLRWEEVAEPAHADVLEWHRRLIQVRRSMPALTTGRLDLIDVRYDEAEQWLLVEREGVTIACNFADEERQISLRAQRPYKVLLASKAPPQVSGESIVLAPESVAVLGE
ncbi:MAG: malto-oligosyltrehalose trehalohydrolase [Pirellulales bacterium]|nr:malto-oligosyltrehalose trehalohydrolase [Pirellulales bacterium]